MTLYGLHELAEALGLPVNLLHVWRHRGKLPPPDAELAMGPVWSARRIGPWLRAQGSPGPRTRTPANGAPEGS